MPVVQGGTDRRVTAGSTPARDHLRRHLIPEVDTRAQPAPLGFPEHAKTLGLLPIGFTWRPAVGVTRRIIFPALRIVIWAVMAVTLVVIAFRSAPQAEGDAVTPSAVVTLPQVAVAKGPITNTVTLTGQVVADPASAEKVTQLGKVTAVRAKVGDVVAVGAPLLEVTLETPQEPLVTKDKETGEETVTERKPKITTSTMKATTAGTIGTFTAIKDQEVAVGDTFATVSPGTLSVSASMLPEQQFRLLTIPTEATVTVTGGPAPFTCTALRMGTAAAAPAEGPGAGGGDPTGAEAGATPSASITCAVPAGVTVFAGLAAKLEVTAGSAQDALLVPITAVQGSVETGNVWLVGEEGAEPVETAVKLGITDGTQVQIVEGVAEGDVVLEFVPGQDVAPVDEGMMYGGSAG